MSRRTRSSSRQSWDEILMARAIQEIAQNDMPKNEAARRYGVPATTLKRRYLWYMINLDLELATAKGMGSFCTIFSPVQESELVDYIILQEEILFGLRSKEVRILAWQMAERNALIHPFSEGRAGKDWLRAFLKRNERLSYRKPKAVLSYPARGFNRIVVGNFFDLLEQQLTLNEVVGVPFPRERFPPDRIFNVDETAVSINPKTHGKILATRGKRQVGKLQASDRGRHITATLCVSASREKLPPFFIFPRKKMVDKLLDESMEGTWGRATETGWMNLDIFFEWFQWFVQTVELTRERPVSLLLDGHSSHKKNLKVIDFARENPVTILCFPPHCTYRLQPLDVSIMKPLSNNYSANISSWLRDHVGRVLTEADIASILSPAFEEAASESNIRNGLRATGIYPSNRDIFSDTDFAAAEVTNRPAPMSSSPEADMNDEMLERTMSELSVEDGPRIQPSSHPATGLLSPFHPVSESDSEVEAPCQSKFD